MQAIKGVQGIGCKIAQLESRVRETGIVERRANRKVSLFPMTSPCRRNFPRVVLLDSVTVVKSRERLRNLAHRPDQRNETLLRPHYSNSNEGRNEILAFFSFIPPPPLPLSLRKSSDEGTHSDNKIDRQIKTSGSIARDAIERTLSEPLEGGKRRFNGCRR